MARTTRKSIAGSAVSAARRAVRRNEAGSAGSSDSSPAKAPAGKGTTTKAASRKAAPKKTAATKSTAKKAPAKKATAKKAPAKKAPAKKAPAKNATAKKATAKKAPAKKAPAKKATAKKATAKKATAKKATAKKATAKKSAAAKKAPATRTAPARKLAVKEGESAWTKAEIDKVRDELTEIREKVASTLEAQETELAGLMRDAGDGAGHDQADMGATSFERDHELTVVNNEREKLSQIDRALARIADGSYGVCESCGNPIGKMRAMAFPRATLCLTCKQREERR